MANRLAPEDCPVELHVLPGSTDEAQGFGDVTALDLVAGAVSDTEVDDFVMGTLYLPGSHPHWQVAAVVPEGRAPSEARLRNRVFLANGTIVTPDNRELIASERTTLARFDVLFGPELFRDAVLDWVQEILPPERLGGEVSSERNAVEVLLHELRVRVLENEKLLALLDERDEVITQLMAERDNLLLELAGRRDFSAERAKGFALGIRNVLATIVLASGAITGTAAAVTTVEGVIPSTHTPSATHLLIDLPTAEGENLRFVSGACDVVIHGPVRETQAPTPGSMPDTAFERSRRSDDGTWVGRGT